MLFNHWFLTNKEFLAGFDADELNDAWELFEEMGVDGIAIGKAFTAMLRAFTGDAIEIVDQDEYETLKSVIAPGRK